MKNTNLMDAITEAIAVAKQISKWQQGLHDEFGGVNSAQCRSALVRATCENSLDAWARVLEYLTEAWPDADDEMKESEAGIAFWAMAEECCDTLVSLEEAKALESGHIPNGDYTDWPEKLESLRDIFEDNAPTVEDNHETWAPSGENLNDGIARAIGMCETVAGCQKDVCEKYVDDIGDQDSVMAWLESVEQAKKANSLSEWHKVMVDWMEIGNDLVDASEENTEVWLTTESLEEALSSLLDATDLYDWLFKQDAAKAEAFEAGCLDDDDYGFIDWHDRLGDAEDFVKNLS